MPCKSIKRCNPILQVLVFNSVWVGYTVKTSKVDKVTSMYVIVDV